MRKSNPHFIFLSGVCVVCTLCAVLVLASSFRSSIFFFSPGFSSWYIAFGVAIGENFASNHFVVLFAIVWFLSFPLLSTAAFIITFFRRYLPFFIVAILDASITVAWTVLCFVSYDPYFGELFLIDAIGSCVVVIMMAIFLWKPRKSSTFANWGDDPKT